MPKETDRATASANKEVRKVQEQAQRQKRGRYHHYNNETHAKIAKYSRDHGNKAAVSKFSSELGHVVTESTVHNMKKAYLSLRERPRQNQKPTACFLGKTVVLMGLRHRCNQVHQEFVGGWWHC